MKIKKNVFKQFYNHHSPKSMLYSLLFEHFKCYIKNYIDTLNILYHCHDAYLLIFSCLILTYNIYD